MVASLGSKQKSTHEGRDQSSISMWDAAFQRLDAKLMLRLMG